MRSAPRPFAVSLAAALCAALAAHAQDPIAVARAPAHVLIENAGRVDWQRVGGERLAFDSISDLATRATDVFTSAPDGSDRRCVTCATRVRAGFRGNPAWHPNGRQLVLQAENERSPHGLRNHLAWGVDNDLWLVAADGSSAERIWVSPQAGAAALHPHFSADGEHLVFAERTPTGKQLPAAFRKYGAYGENHWDGWALHLARVDVSRRGPAMLSEHRVLKPLGGGFYEPSAFLADGRILFAYTKGGQPYCNDVYVWDPDAGPPQNLTSSVGVWDEFGQRSPDGRTLSFVSSRFDESLRYPRSRTRDLRTELFLKRGASPLERATWVNDAGAKRVVSDYAWSPDGKRIVFQVAELASERPPDLWVLELR